MSRFLTDFNRTAMIDTKFTMVKRYERTNDHDATILLLGINPAAIDINPITINKTTVRCNLDNKRISFDLPANSSARIAIPTTNDTGYLSKAKGNAPIVNSRRRPENSIAETIII